MDLSTRFFTGQARAVSACNSLSHGTAECSKGSATKKGSGCCKREGGKAPGDNGPASKCCPFSKNWAPDLCAEFNAMCAPLVLDANTATCAPSVTVSILLSSACQGGKQ